MCWMCAVKHQYAWILFHKLWNEAISVVICWLCCLVKDLYYLYAFYIYTVS